MSGSSDTIIESLRRGATDTRWRNASARLHSALASSDGYVVVTSASGHEAATFVDAVLTEIDPFRIIRLTPNVGDPLALIDRHCAIVEREQNSDAAHATNGHTGLARLAELAAAAGKPICIVVRDAESADPDELEKIRMAFTIAPGSSSTELRIVLVGTLELEAKLEQHAARAIASRVSARIRLTRAAMRTSLREPSPIPRRGSRLRKPAIAIACTLALAAAFDAARGLSLPALPELPSLSAMKGIGLPGLPSLGSKRTADPASTKSAAQAGTSVPAATPSNAVASAIASAPSTAVIDNGPAASGLASTKTALTAGADPAAPVPTPLARVARAVESGLGSVGLEAYVPAVVARAAATTRVQTRPSVATSSHGYSSFPVREREAGLATQLMAHTLATFDARRTGSTSIVQAGTFTDIDGAFALKHTLVDSVGAAYVARFDPTWGTFYSVRVFSSSGASGSDLAIDVSRSLGHETTHVSPAVVASPAPAPAEVATTVVEGSR